MKISRILLMTTSLALATSLPVRAQDDAAEDLRGKRYERVEVVFDRIAPPAGLEAAIAELKQQVANRSLKEIAALVADDFFRERDFAEIFNPDLSPAENFSLALNIDPMRTPEDYIDEGWAELSRILDGSGFGPAEEAGDAICTASLARFADEDKAIVSFNALGSDFIFDWMYVEGAASVFALPDRTSAAKAELKDEAVYILDLTYDGDRVTFVEVLLPDGSAGHVASETLGSFMDGRLCFSEDEAGRWRIAGFIGGRAL